MNRDRRTLIAGAGGLAAVSSLGWLGQAAGAAQLKAIGLQLYTVREIFQKDPVGTLEKVARVGYREVEFGGGGYDAMDPKLLRRTMDRLGLVSPSIHTSLDALTGTFDKVVTTAKTLGADTVVVAYTPEERRSEAEWSKMLPAMDRAGERLRTAGLGLAYHNHNFEFTIRPGGVSLYDRLIKGTDPALVKLELDLYWALKAGENAADLIGRLNSRLYAFHVKDMKPDGSMAAVGAGTVDFAALFRLPGAAQVKHFYVEDDEAPAPYIPDITTSYKTLRALRF